MFVNNSFPMLVTVLFRFMCRYVRLLHYSRIPIDGFYDSHDIQPNHRIRENICHITLIIKGRLLHDSKVLHHAVLNNVIDYLIHKINLSVIHIAE